MSALEIERKFLVKDTNYKQQATGSSHILQGYICSGGGRTVRVRQRDDKAYLTIKGPSFDGGVSRYEFEKEIAADEARELFKLCEPGIIDKRRYLVPYEGHTFEVDEFYGDNEGLVMAEVELSAPDETFARPAFLGHEVTGDKRFYNSHLRLNPFSIWGREALRKLGFLALLLMFLLPAKADGLDEIRNALQHASETRVQEKVFVHTDNECYFVGDTLWYKAYVVLANSHELTDLSRVLYVELLSPDGLVVERQTVVVSKRGYTCGQFVLQDSLYSGYYELRAYTRWMLNFNVSTEHYRVHDSWWFYNKQMAAEFFRTWDGLYSRVFPIYSKPDAPGDYDARRMYQRPKTRIPKPKKEELFADFFPEGGHIIDGVPNRIAFELKDQNGEAVNLKGTVATGSGPSTDIKTDFMGRGAFIVTPSGHRLKATFTYRGKKYDFTLPKNESKGAAVMLNDGRLSIAARGLPADRQYGLSVMCRGRLCHFQAVDLASGSATVELPADDLPSGVCDVTLFDDRRQVLADRLFFVNHHENDALRMTTDITPTTTFEPYQQVDFTVSCPAITEPTRFSLSIRDTNTDEPTYNDGNIMTDLLLSSELRGFIARPAHYFESDDDLHRHHLDLLMMVQGWRKYKWDELADTTQKLRYLPETGLTVEGCVYKMLSLNEVDPEEVKNWVNGVGMIGHKSDAEEQDFSDPFANDNDATQTITDGMTMSDNGAADDSDIEYGTIGNANAAMGVNHGNLRKEVLVEAEIIVGDKVVGSTQKTDGGRFLFKVPPFYGDAFLNMKAYKQNDSIKKNMQSRKDVKVMDEDSYADFYVKRDLFFPVFAHDYNYYEKHQPDFETSLLIDTLSDLSMENDVHQLGNVNVKGKRRGRRAIDYTKPAYVIDAYEAYNDITDRGLSYGKFDMRQFPVQVAKLLYGNMNRYNMYNVDGRLESQVYYRNYNDLAMGTDVERMSKCLDNRSSDYIYQRLRLKRLENIRIYTDYEPRTKDSTMVESQHEPDVTVEMVPFANDVQQPTFRDRHIVFHGFSQPEAFYQPDYSGQMPATPSDYRRTLYWNPNCLTDEQGTFTGTFFNNSKQTRVKISVAGVTANGGLVH